MGIKIINENKPNQLLGVIKREYRLANLLLLIISILSLGLCGEYWQSLTNKGYSLIRYFLVFLYVLIFLISSFTFFKDSFLQICSINWPSFKQIFSNVLQVVFFTLFLVGYVYIAKFCIGKMS